MRTRMYGGVRGGVSDGPAYSIDAYPLTASFLLVGRVVGREHLSGCMRIV